MPRYALIALKPFPYGRLKLQPGDAFEALDQSAYGLFTRVGLARPADDSTVVAPRPVVEAPPDVVAPRVPRVVEPGETALPMTFKRKRGRPRKYARKDLEAE